MAAKDSKTRKKIPTSFICLLIACIIELVIGILLLINPVGFTAAIVTVAGLALIVWGVFCAIRYFKTSPAEASQHQELAKGFGAILLGGICVFQFNWLVMATPLLGGAYGLAILAAGVFKTQRAVDLLRLKRQFWYIAAAGALVALVMGFIVLLNPFTSSFLWIFIAIALLATGAIDIVALCLSPRERPVKTQIVMNEKGAVETVSVKNAPEAAAALEEPASIPAPVPSPASAPTPAQTTETSK